MKLSSRIALGVRGRHSRQTPHSVASRNMSVGLAILGNERVLLFGAPALTLASKCYRYFNGDADVELGFVVSHTSSAVSRRVRVNTLDYRVRMGIDFTTTGASLIFAFLNGSLTYVYIGLQHDFGTS